jgi:hypothetical protein
MDNLTQLNKGTNMNNLPTQSAVSLPAAKIEAVINQRKAIMQAVKEAMLVDVHYGTIPGTKKPTCLKPGAEVLCLLFGLRPQFEEKTEHRGDHLETVYTCTLYSPDGFIMGQGVGSCSTMESKYRWRNAARKCPACGIEAISKSKEEYGGGYYCNKKAGGCGAKFNKGDATIEKQECGKIENADIADLFNTVRKMAKKRAHIDAALTTTGASEFFTQDMEDSPEYPEHTEPIKCKVVTPKDYAKPIYPGATSTMFMRHFYVLTAVDANKLDEVQCYLNTEKAVFDDVANLWIADHPLKKLVKHEISEQQAMDRLQAAEEELKKAAAA